jgi:hypothetical protein
MVVRSVKYGFCQVLGFQDKYETEIWYTIITQGDEGDGTTSFDNALFQCTSFTVKLGLFVFSLDTSLTISLHDVFDDLLQVITLRYGKSHKHCLGVK